jgi:hypothetical protein
MSVLKVYDSRLAKPDHPSTCPPRLITHLDSSSVDYFFLAASRNDQRSGCHDIFEVIEEIRSHNNSIHFTKVLEIALLYRVI